MKELRITLGGNELLLSSAKSAYDPVHEILYIADLHAGKSATLRMHGVPVPESMLADDLERLSNLICHYNPREFLVLGDFFHARSGRQPEVFELLLAFRNRHSELAMSVIIGNHDISSGPLPSQLRLRFEDEQVVRGNFTLRHTPDETRETRVSTNVLCGHIHPAVKIPSIGSIPCFMKRNSQLILPSFGSTTGSAIMARDGVTEFFPVMHDEIFSLV